MNSEIAVQPRAEIAQVTPMYLIQQAAASGASIEQMQQLFELKLRVEADENRKAYNQAMAQFKAHPPRITKNVSKKAGQMDLHYASLDHVCDALIPALAAVGIRHAWSMKQDAGQMTVTCTLTHEMGHAESTSMSAPYDQSGGKNAIQAIASAQTYAQRYTLLAATGQAAGGMDDDGNASGKADNDGAPKRPQMDERDLATRLDYIEAAQNLAELKKVTGAAHAAATGIGDQDALKAIDAAYQRRKAAL